MTDRLTDFAVLEPSNLQAKLDFNYVVDKLTEQRQNHSSRHVQYDKQPRYDGDIFRFRTRQNLARVEELGTVSASSTEVDSDSDDNARQSGMIWTGYYSFNLEVRPSNSLRGWVAGRDSAAEIPLGQEDKQNGIRSRHILFNFHHESTGFLSILSKGPRDGRGQISVNGIGVARGMTCSLNQMTSIIRLGSLE